MRPSPVAALGLISYAGQSDIVVEALAGRLRRQST